MCYYSIINISFNFGVGHALGSYGCARAFLVPPFIVPFLFFLCVLFVLLSVLFLFCFCLFSFLFCSFCCLCLFVLLLCRVNGICVTMLYLYSVCGCLSGCSRCPTSLLYPRCAWLRLR